jgi:ABC-type transporter Mla subunit MlaD
VALVLTAIGLLRAGTPRVTVTSDRSNGLERARNVDIAGVSSAE